jgi:hypothetical protein
MAVASFAHDPDDANLATGPTLPRGSGLRARQAVGQNTHCEFRTASALRLWPIEVQRAQYFTYAPDLPLNTHPQSRAIRGGLRIGLHATAGLKFNQIAALGRNGRFQQVGTDSKGFTNRGIGRGRDNRGSRARSTGLQGYGRRWRSATSGSCYSIRCRFRLVVFLPAFPQHEAGESENQNQNKASSVHELPM